MPYVGEIKEFGGNFAPAGWMLCQGQLLPISEYDTLFTLIGTTYGGDGQSTFALPDLRGRVPIHFGNAYIQGEAAGSESVTLTVQQIPQHTHTPVGVPVGGSDSPAGNVWGNSTSGKPYNSVATAPTLAMHNSSVAISGGSQPHDNMIPYLAVNFIISLFGVFPVSGSGSAQETPYMSELKLFSFNYAPGGWALCNGQFLPINQNQALFSLLGTTYGGNGQTTFALPDMRGCVAMHLGNGFTQGQKAGEVSHTITFSEMPAHTHSAIASANAPNQAGPTGNMWASNTGFTPYGALASASTMHPGSVTNIGGSQPHNNMSPYLVLNYCIALVGIFPSRN